MFIIFGVGFGLFFWVFFVCSVNSFALLVFKNFFSSHFFLEIAFGSTLIRSSNIT